MEGGLDMPDSTGGARIFALPVEEELEYLRCKYDCGPRAIFTGLRPCHVGDSWDGNSTGDCGQDGDDISLAVVCGADESQMQAWRMKGRSTNEGESYHPLIQLLEHKQRKRKRAAIGGDSAVAQSLFRAVAEGGGSRMHSRAMAHLASSMARLIDGEPGMRAFLRQTGHSLPRGVLRADRAARELPRGEVPWWVASLDGLQILVPGIPGEGALRERLRRRVKDILWQALADRPWAGWAAREDIALAPVVHDNWRLLPWEGKHAERLTIRRILDGAARAHIAKPKLERVPPCPCCRGGQDEQEHWLLRCPAMQEQREAAWGKVVNEVGECSLSCGRVFRQHGSSTARSGVIAFCWRPNCSRWAKSHSYEPTAPI
eukprot:gene23983-biopygen19381